MFLFKDIIQKNYQISVNTTDFYKKVIKFYTAYWFSSIILDLNSEKKINTISVLLKSYCIRQNNNAKLILESHIRSDENIINAALNLLEPEMPATGINEIINFRYTDGCFGVEVN